MNMKKIYMKPTIEVVDIELEQVIANSPAMNSTDLDEYGQLEEVGGDAMSKDRGSFLGF